MTAIDNLDQALANLNAQLGGRYVFVSTQDVPDGVDPFAVIREPEALTLVVREDQARDAGLDCSHLYSQIAGGVETSLMTAGITATVAATMASRGIACNVIAGLHHDYFFVPSSREDEALALVRSLSAQAQGWLPA